MNLIQNIQIIKDHQWKSFYNHEYGVINEDKIIPFENFSEFSGLIIR